jgi:hypothetical protein
MCPYVFSKSISNFYILVQIFEIYYLFVTFTKYIIAVTFFWFWRELNVQYLLRQAILSLHVCIH